ncbi:CSS-motif domain-containing protein [Pseudomonas sp. CC120222-01a]|uniref:CSS-motif domain-containing protein n=1 Tax=Pseudomonas sp. CC120222-01a TaxID=1378075 RepID=UPI000D951E7E|nr:CSS-motif domain-containing protein [Pseudomonas sp. CC120222-01a]PVZ42248.1 CSS domain containing protein [Pseudomonas sp. CC120222-01a]
MELLLALAISLLPVLSGLMILFYQHDKKLEETARISVNEAIYSVDLALDRIHASASTALMLAGATCESAEPQLLDQVAKAPHLRSLALTVDGSTYCNTLKTPYPPDHMFPDAQSQFRLALHPPATPNSVLLAYQLTEQNMGVIATSYGMLLRNELRAFQTGLTLLLEFGELYIWTDGDSRDPMRPSQEEFFKEGISTKYGYTVKAGYAAGYSAHETRQTMKQLFPSLALVGVITGSITYWGLFRQRNQRVRSAANNG